MRTCGIVLSLVLCWLSPAASSIGELTALECAAEDLSDSTSLGVVTFSQQTWSMKLVKGVDEADSLEVQYHALVAIDLFAPMEGKEILVPYKISLNCFDEEGASGIGFGRSRVTIQLDSKGFSGQVPLEINRRIPQHTPEGKSGKLRVHDALGLDLFDPYVLAAGASASMSHMPR